MTKEFKVGDRVTYDGRRPPQGIIVEIITTSATPYRVRWDTGKVSDWAAEGLKRVPVVSGPGPRLEMSEVKTTPPEDPPDEDGKHRIIVLPPSREKPTAEIDE